MKGLTLNLVLLTMLACGCQDETKTPLNVWGMTDSSGAMVRLGLGDKLQTGAELAYSDTLQEVIMAGAYATIDLAERVEVNNPLPLPFLGDKLFATTYVGAHLGWVDTLTRDVSWNKTHIFGGPVAGVKMAGNERFALVAEYQYRIGEAGKDPLGDLEMHSVYMVGAWIRF